MPDHNCEGIIIIIYIISGAYKPPKGRLIIYIHACVLEIRMRSVILAHVSSVGVVSCDNVLAQMRMG